MPGVTGVRRAVATDAARIRELAAEVQAMHAAAMPSLFKAGGGATEALIVERMREPLRHAYWVAEREGDVVGHAYAEVVEEPESAWRFAHRWIALHELAVVERARGDGVGARLLAAVRAWAHEQRAARVVVNVWGFNHGARRFYAREGFDTFHERLTCELPTR